MPIVSNLTCACTGTPFEQGPLTKRVTKIQLNWGLSHCTEPYVLIGITNVLSWNRSRTIRLSRYTLSIFRSRCCPGVFGVGIPRWFINILQTVVLVSACDAVGSTPPAAAACSLNKASVKKSCHHQCIWPDVRPKKDTSPQGTEIVDRGLGGIYTYTYTLSTRWIVFIVGPLLEAFYLWRIVQRLHRMSWLGAAVRIPSKWTIRMIIW